MNNNPVLALIENDTPDKFAEDVANAFFANPAYVRKLLNADCIESCVDYVLSNQRVEFDLSDLALFEDEEPFFTKSSRQRRRRKHNKKASRRKGSAKRFRDHSRKAAHEEHLYKVYNRGLAGDWNRRGRRLEDAGQVAFKTNQRLVRDIEVDPEVQDEEEIRTFTYTDGFTLSMSMSKSAWEKEEEDDFSPSFNWDRKYALEQVDNDEDWLDDDDWVNWENEWDNEDDDEIIDAPDPKKPSSSYDTSEFTAIELAQMSMKLACATPDQRAWIREFMKSF